MCLWSIFATLKDDKRNRANDWDEVERQVHEVPYDRGRGKLGERLAHKASKSSDSVACSARLDLTLFGHKLGVTCTCVRIVVCSLERVHTFGDQGAIECVNQAVLDQERFRKYGGQRAAFAQNQ